MSIINAIIILLVKVSHNSKNGPLICILVKAFMKMEWHYNKNKYQISYHTVVIQLFNKTAS